MKMIFLVDGDNNIGTGLKGVDMLSNQDTVLIFYQKEKGLPLTKLQKLCAGTAADVQYIESVRGGKNSIDFQIITGGRFRLRHQPRQGLRRLHRRPAGPVCQRLSGGCPPPLH